MSVTVDATARAFLPPGSARAGAPRAVLLRGTAVDAGLHREGRPGRHTVAPALLQAELVRSDWFGTGAFIVQARPRQPLSSQPVRPSPPTIGAFLRRFPANWPACRRG
ncbi:hypothetical protein E7X58_26755 [Streptomyces sp. A1499]|nr:hypothetical protein E7X58_26755 [Streptomyces sp. A1499]